MKPSEVGNPYPSEDQTFIEPVYKISLHELHEKMLKVKVQQEILKNRAVEQIKEEIKAIVKKLPVDLSTRVSINSRIVKLERVIEDFYRQ